MNGTIRSARTQGRYLARGGDIRRDVLDRRTSKRRKLTSEVEDVLQCASVVD